ncbi:MFS transporter [Oceanicola sp. 502str15]|uniref:MFS transporter n=1 Tax=Oceanicola sp. 502str15 TaxID=2696061 RepID=UPI002095140A|nr:MFS transporter [Oceanicola sp. 502str15]MCO6383077.1 MFS transporter [Oceanicola sp. 502str15]
MRLLLTFAPLLVAVALLQLSTGGLGPMDALSGLTLGFSTGEIGLLGSAHFTGFFLGCWWAPRLMGTVGHARAFAAFTALGAIGLLGHMLLTTPWAWAGMRVASGLCIAGCYTVIEAWLQAQVTNETRGRAMGGYRLVDMGGSLLAQLLVGILAPAAYASYTLLAILCCAALLPLTLTNAPQPATPEAPRLHPALAFARSPLAGAAVLVAGLTSGSFRTVGPVYGQAVGLAPEQIGLFLAIWIGGGALAQWPVGWLADRYDRRWVLIGLSIASTLACLLTLATSGSTAAILVAAAVFGLTSFPIYSVAAAHAHDWATDDERVELSASLMFAFAAGAIAAPLTVSWLMAATGPAALFVLIALAHVALAVIGTLRMRARATSAARTRYVYAPRTSFLVGLLTRRQRRP